MRVVLYFMVFLFPYGASAQATNPLILDSAVAHHMHAIAGDSGTSRAAPSQGLEETARYIAEQFQGLGLQPGSGDNSWFQRYVIPARLNLARSQIVFAVGDKKVAAGLGPAARLIMPFVGARQDAKGAVLMTGRLPWPSNHIPGGTIVLYVPPANLSAIERRRLIQRALRSSIESHDIVILDDDDPAPIDSSDPSSQFVRFSASWAARVQPSKVRGLRDLLAATGVAINTTDTTPTVRPLPSLKVALEADLDRTERDSTMALNVIGVLDGTDPKLKQEYVVFSAPMDLPAGANDASGAAGLIELARAFSQPGARPARSLVFLATSGTTEAFAGSRAFADYYQAPRLLIKDAVSKLSALSAFGGGGSGSSKYGTQYHVDGDQWTITTDAGTQVTFDWDTVANNPIPAGPLGGLARKVASLSPSRGTISDESGPRIVASIGLDALGFGPRDSIWIDGLDDVALAHPLSWIMALHSELQFIPADGGTVARPESSQFAFVTANIPSLNFHGDRRLDRVIPARMADASQVALALRLIYHVAQDIASAARPVAWTPEGRQRYFDSVER